MVSILFIVIPSFNQSETKGCVFDTRVNDSISVALFCFEELRIYVKQHRMS